MKEKRQQGRNPEIRSSDFFPIQLVPLTQMERVVVGRSRMEWQGVLKENENHKTYYLLFVIFQVFIRHLREDVD